MLYLFFFYCSLLLAPNLGEQSVIGCLVEYTAFVYVLLLSLFVYCHIYFVCYIISFALINDGGAGVVMLP